MFQCNLCDKYIEDGCTIYKVKQGIVIDEEGDDLDMEEKENIYCSPLCLATDYDP